jgi:CheY-like chemotaxis protein
MSHEIRTPLTAIIGFSEMLLEDDIPKEEQISSTNTIINSGKHLLSIINDILDVSKIEADKIELENSNFSIFKMIVEVDSIMSIQASSKGIGFDVLYHFPLPENINSDIVRIKQILINLCNNAIKFTETGYVTVEVSCDNLMNQIRFSVIDTGIGISNEQKEKIFNAFEQADSSTTRKYGGTGLGLHLSKRLAIMLGGDITVNSNLGNGSNFNVIVKTGTLEPANFLSEKPSDLPTKNHLNNSPISKLVGNVLLVEDNKENQNLISMYIEKTGATVTVAENGKIAVDNAMTQDFDLILMDLQMPVLGGIEATQLLRSKGYVSPIVALTASTMEHEIKACSDAGFDDFLAKPIDRSKFFRLLYDHLEPCIEENPATKPIFSALLDEDSTLIDMVEYYVSKLPTLVADIVKASLERDFESLRFKIHDLKSTGGGYGYPILSELACRITDELSQGDYESVLSLIESLREYSNRIVLGFDSAKENFSSQDKSTKLG